MILMAVAAVCAFAAALILGKLVIPALRALKAGQSIREIGPKWHNSKAGTPTMGGIIFIFSALIVLLIFAFGFKECGPTALFVMALALVYGAIGFADDFIKVKLKRNLGLTALQKFLLQLAVAVLFLLLLKKSGAMTCDLWIPFFNRTYEVNTVVYIVFAAFVLVGCVNAVNLTDGIDGLATGVTMPVMAFFAVVCILRKDTQLGLLPAVLLGALGGFLCYNFHPAKVFMGDTGSLFLGAAVSGLAFALDIPLILVPVGFVYIVETLSVMMQVTYFKLTHQRIFKMTPIHHHFELCGWSEVTIFAVFTAICTVLCLISVFGNLQAFSA